MCRTRPALNAQHVELAGEIAEGDCAVAGHRPRGERGTALGHGETLQALTLSRGDIADSFDL
jgi:hypothetical protein